jgi:hypothetical protein
MDIDKCEVSGLVLEYLHDLGAQKLADVVDRMRGDDSFYAKRNWKKLSEVVGEQLRNLFDNRLVDYNAESGCWSLTDKFEVGKVYQIYDGCTVMVEPAPVDKPADAERKDEQKKMGAEHPFAPFFPKELWPDDRPVFPKIHKFANLLPMLSEEKMKALADDIKARGLLEPVMYHDGELLDGRNRWVGCQWAKHEPRAETLPPETDPLDYVVSKNVLGRQLTEVQEMVFAEKAATATVGRKKQAGALSVWTRWRTG